MFDVGHQNSKNPPPLFGNEPAEIQAVHVKHAKEYIETERQT